jgi:hypothetical protein
MQVARSAKADAGCENGCYVRRGRQRRGRRRHPVTTHVAGGTEGSIRARAKAISSGWISHEILIMLE